MNIDTLIENFVKELDFDALIAWANMLGVEYVRDWNDWNDDDRPDKEDELRVAVAEAMGQVGKE